MRWKSVTPESRRTDSPKHRSQSSRSSIHYLGYVDDGESTDTIMRKFQELERLERELAERRHVSDDPFVEKDALMDVMATETGMNVSRGELAERDLRELLRRTRKYDQSGGYVDADGLYWPPRNVADEYAASDNDNDDNQLYFLPTQQSEDAEDDEMDTQSWSDDENANTSSRPRHRQRPPKTVSLASPRSPHHSLTTSAPSVIKPRVHPIRVVDEDAPTLMKLPPLPIPATWAHIVSNPLQRELQMHERCREFTVTSVFDEAAQWIAALQGQKVQGIYMRPPFNAHFTVDYWGQCMRDILPAILDHGYLFVWVEREDLAAVIRAADRHLSFKYVENLCWIRRELNNRTQMLPGPLLCRSKMTLLVLRRDPDGVVKLRHQRNADCVFDFVGNGRMPDGRVYDVIETLLDGGSTKERGPHLMHLWADGSPTDRLVFQSRRHWIRIVEEDCN